MVLAGQDLQCKLHEVAPQPDLFGGFRYQGRTAEIIHRDLTPLCSISSWPCGFRHPRLLPSTLRLRHLSTGPDKVVSFYNYVHEEPRHYLHEQVATAGMAMDDFLISDMTIELANLQVRMPTGTEKYVPFGALTKETGSMFASIPRSRRGGNTA